MQRTRISLVALTTLAAVSLTMTGCGRRGLITINGEKIKKDDFYARLEQQPVPVSENGLIRVITVDGKLTYGRPVDQRPVGQMVISTMIQEKLLEQLAKKENVPVTEKQIQDKLDKTKAQYPGSIPRAALDSMKHDITVQQAQINLITKGISVSDSDVRTMYDKLAAQPVSAVRRPAQVNMDYIVATKQQSIIEAKKRLDKGTDFATVAKEMSEDSLTREKGGAVGWVSKYDRGYPQAIKDKAFTLKRDQVSEPMDVEKKWVIVKVTGSRPEKVRSFDEMKDEITEALKVQKGQMKPDYAKMMQDYIAKSDVTINADRYKSLADQMKSGAKDNLKKLEELENKMKTAPVKNP